MRENGNGYILVNYDTALREGSSFGHPNNTNHRPILCMNFVQGEDQKLPYISI
jgi:hypothetical protein